MFNSSMYLPYTLFESVTRFNDDSAGDMQCGDMGEEELLVLGLNDISEKVDPYRLIRYPFPHPVGIDGYFGSSTSGIKISHSECVDILFTEMKELAGMFSFYGEYRFLIEELIGHFRYGNGSPFYSQQLNSAFHKRINKNIKDSPLFIIKDCIQIELKKTQEKSTYPQYCMKSKQIYLAHISLNLIISRTESMDWGSAFTISLRKR